MKGTLVLAALLTGCGTAEDIDTPRVVVGDIEFAAPTGWAPQELGPTTRVWSPDDNPRKETITVVVGPTFIGSFDQALAATSSAQRSLRDLRLLASYPVATANGLNGLRMDLTFRPDIVGQPVYGRSHVVLIAGDHTVHVLYTAAKPDPARAVLLQVLNTIRKDG